MPTTIALPIVEVTQVGHARRAATSLARAMNFDETAEGRVAVLATELSTNLVKHGGGGEVVLQRDDRGATRTFQMWALDRGPGMKNFGECMRDGFSTAGSPGTGLGAVSRLADQFDVYTGQGQGTVIYAAICADKARTAVTACPVAAINVPILGETVSGDDWAANCETTRARVMVVDGLGHGPDAAAAAKTALQTWKVYARESPQEFVQNAHLALRATRGAALAVAWIDTQRRTVTFAGVGNISATLVSPTLTTKNMVSINGTVGMDARKVQEFNYSYDAATNLIMHSDGLTTRWRLDPYPGLSVRHPALIAGVLYRDHKRGRDDATVMVLKLQ